LVVKIGFGSQKPKRKQFEKKKMWLSRKTRRKSLGLILSYEPKQKTFKKKLKYFVLRMGTSGEVLVGH
jgi:hypothetical protein